MIPAKTSHQIATDYELNTLSSNDEMRKRKYLNNKTFETHTHTHARTHAHTHTPSSVNYDQTLPLSNCLKGESLARQTAIRGRVKYTCTSINEIITSILEFN